MSANTCGAARMATPGRRWPQKLHRTPNCPVLAEPAGGKIWVAVILPALALFTIAWPGSAAPLEGSPRLVWFKTLLNEATT